MLRSFYENELSQFLALSDSEIIGIITTNNPFALESLQRNSWIEEIIILKEQLCEFKHGYIAIEYTIPRMGKRVDVVYIINGLVFVIEFKIGAKKYDKQYIDQTIDYVLDLKNFHKESHNRILIPILVSTDAESIENNYFEIKSGIVDIQKCNKNNLKDTIKNILNIYPITNLEPCNWINSEYSPTPTIIEAAQALYNKHDVSNISRNDASAINLNITTKKIINIIDESQIYNKKTICFITGVPGAGKTLAGLNIANASHSFADDKHAVFLSGNQPLVSVLQEALARDENKRNKTKMSEALSKTKAFIQNIHHFRDNYLLELGAPIEKVVIFDEAQRAWTKDMLSDFMRKKKGKSNFDKSEPEFLIEIMDRHSEWAVIVCLIGGGQEINTGEAGLEEWFNALKDKRFRDWNIYVSDKITDSEYIKNKSFNQFTEDLKYSIYQELHLSVSIRSFRSENLSHFIKALLDEDKCMAQKIYSELQNKYPIVLTRDLVAAKEWVRSNAKGTERFGIIASSGAKRLRANGIWVQNKINPESWFLNDYSDVRSSYYLEEVATEFDVQGLELDWAVVCWDADLRFSTNHFTYHRFVGTKWTNIGRDEKINYLKNAYRVILTRARQGMVIYVPNGDMSDATRSCNYYDPTYNYLKSIGIVEL